MLLSLIRALGTNDLQKVVMHLSMAPIDIDLILYEAQENGEIEINKKKSKIKVLKESEHVYYSYELVEKLLAIVDYYDKQEANITRNRLEEITLGLGGKYGYPIHDFICTIYALEQGLVPGRPAVNRYEITVPEVKKKRPANIFVFYTLLDHQEFGAKAVNEFIDTWSKLNVK